jgi:flagellin
MPITLLDNKTTLTALRYLTTNGKQLNKSLERLASGYKINRASDNAAGLLISENLRSQMRGFDMASQNSQQGLSMLQTADGALQQVNEHLQKIREIAVAAQNGTTSTAQYTAYQADLQAQINSINSISTGTEYNNQVLLNGSISGSASFIIQIGPNSGDTLDIKTAFSSAAVGAAGIGAISGTLANATDANTILGQVDTALASVASKLATVGQYENSLEDQMNYLAIAKENTSAAESSIRETDIAEETARAARYQILQQASVYALSQANATASLASRLLQ